MRRLLRIAWRIFFAPPPPPEVPPEVPHLALLRGLYRTPQPQTTHCELCGSPMTDTSPCPARLKSDTKETV